MPELPIEITVQDTSALLQSPGPGPRPRLIDCREEDEWQICRIPGAELAPLTRFGEEARTRFTDPAQHLIIYCHHGMRSLRAASWLRDQGFPNTQSMAGGIDRWTDLIDPAMPRY
ncbi:MAG TPA: rhodanese-like domain-containing protein [bacterium]|nr:rhodanese-like domain-containing protein [bacterium]